MKVKISFTIELSDDQRKAIAHAMGEEGMASYDAVQAFYKDRIALVVRDSLDSPMREYYRMKAAQYSALAEE